MAGKLERELRYILTSAELDLMVDQVRSGRANFADGYSGHELTVMFDNPNPAFSFYDAAIDGRLRLRTLKAAKGIIVTKEPPEICLLTWKRRLANHGEDDLLTEEEIEVPVDSRSSEDVAAILESVLRCPRMASYERFRETLVCRGVEIAIDRFPYGAVVELELKVGEDPSPLYEVAEILNLREQRRSRLSCDDMYRELCQHQGVAAQIDILFSDTTMPSLDRYLEPIS